MVTTLQARCLTLIPIFVLTAGVGSACSQSPEYFLQRLGRVNAYTGTSTYSYYLDLESDKKVLNEWTKAIDEEAERIRRTEKDYAARLQGLRSMEGIIENLRNRLDRESAAIKARQADLEAVESNRFQGEMEEYGSRRIGNINDWGYAYKFYDGAGSRVDGKIEEEKSSIASDVASFFKGQESLNKELNKLRESRAQLKTQYDRIQQMYKAYSEKRSKLDEQLSIWDERREYYDAWIEAEESQRTDPGVDLEWLRRRIDNELIKRGRSRH